MARYEDLESSRRLTHGTLRQVFRSSQPGGQRRLLGGAATIPRHVGTEIAGMIKLMTEQHGGGVETMAQTLAGAQVPFLANPVKQHLIDGRWSPSLSGETFETRNPSTGQVLASLARGRTEDVDAAVSAARRAFEGPWSRLTTNQRMNVLLRAADMLERNFDELALLEALDMGAPLARIQGMKAGLIQTVQFMASQAVSYAGHN